MKLVHAFYIPTTPMENDERLPGNAEFPHSSSVYNNKTFDT